VRSRPTPRTATTARSSSLPRSVHPLRSSAPG
jgi:hypothetical protein